MMDNFSFGNIWHTLGPVVQNNVVKTAFVIGLFILLRAIFTRLIDRRIDNPVAQYQLRKSVAYLLGFAALLLTARVWIDEFGSISTFLGLLSAGIAVALKDPIVNLAGWMFIMWRRPFQVGDRVEIGSTKGDVIDIRIFQFTLMEVGVWVDAEQSTGRIIHVPNASVFQQPQANYSRGFKYLWGEIGVLVTFESNWRHAKEILLEIATKHSAHLSELAEKEVRHAARKYMIFFSHLTPTVYTSVKDSGVMLSLRFLVEPRRRRSTEHEIWEAVLDAFAEIDDIEFAYPSIRYYDNHVESKSSQNKGAKDDNGTS